MKSNDLKRSPLKRKPLRNPGESLQEEMARLFDEEFLPVLAVALITIPLTIYEWLAWYFKWPRQPLVMTMVLLVAGGYTVYQFFVVRKQYRNLRLGLEGEKAVGQYLEDLRSQGCRIFHDIVGDKFNIDHLIVSPHGIFVIETKTYSKPIRGEAIIKYDGEQVLINGMEPDRNPIIQARALGKWLEDLLAESTGRKFAIKCVVVFPGWFIETKVENSSGVWVLNPRALPSFIEHEPIVLKSEDIALVASRIILHNANG